MYMVAHLTLVNQIFHTKGPFTYGRLATGDGADR